MSGSNSVKVGGRERSRRPWTRTPLASAAAAATWRDQPERSSQIAGSATALSAATSAFQVPTNSRSVVLPAYARFPERTVSGAVTV